MDRGCGSERVGHAAYLVVVLTVNDVSCAVNGVGRRVGRGCGVGIHVLVNLRIHKTF